MKIVETTKPNDRTFTLEVNEDELKFIWYWSTTGAPKLFGVGDRLDILVRKILPDVHFDVDYTKCFK